MNTGQSSKSEKSQSSKSTSSSTPRTSQRAIKRPRYYDNDDSVDFELPKSNIKKTKSSQKGTAKTAAKKPGHTRKVIVECVLSSEVTDCSCTATGCSQGPGQVETN